ncbi:MAG: 30S ribosomal protein S9 [bacterium]
MVKTGDITKYIEGIGRRKTAIARVRIYPDADKADFIINGQKVTDYFDTLRYLKTAQHPLEVTKTKMSVETKVKGGGMTAQAEAVRMGLSRALVKYKEETKPALKSRGYLTRDSRMVERKKYGRRKARRAFQWKKR